MSASGGLPYAICMGPCFGCGRMFTFHPDKVPSIEVEGVKQPICRACVERVNPVREEHGLAPIVPLPNAYWDEPELEES